MGLVQHGLCTKYVEQNCKQYEKKGRVINATGSILISMCPPRPPITYEFIKENNGQLSREPFDNFHMAGSN